MMKRKQKTKTTAPKSKVIRKPAPPSQSKLARSIQKLSDDICILNNSMDRWEVHLIGLVRSHKGLCERIDDRDAALDSSIRSIRDAIAKHTLSLQADFEEVSKFLFAGWGIRILPETLRILRHQDIADKVMQAMRAKTWVEPIESLVAPTNGKGA